MSQSSTRKTRRGDAQPRRLRAPPGDSSDRELTALYDAPRDSSRRSPSRPPRAISALQSERSRYADRRYFSSLRQRDVIDHAAARAATERGRLNEPGAGLGLHLVCSPIVASLIVNVDLGRHRCPVWQRREYHILLLSCSMHGANRARAFTTPVAGGAPASRARDLDDMDELRRHARWLRGACLRQPLLVGLLAPSHRRATRSTCRGDNISAGDLIVVVPY